MNRPENCPHCRSYHGAEDWHLDPEAHSPRLTVGQNVAAREETAVCRIGEIGRVTEVHTVSNRPVSHYSSQPLCHGPPRIAHSRIQGFSPSAATGPVRVRGLACGSAMLPARGPLPAAHGDPVARPAAPLRTLELRLLPLPGRPIGTGPVTHRCKAINAFQKPVATAHLALPKLTFGANGEAYLDRRENHREDCYKAPLQHIIFSFQTR